jgi:TolA-binding protein
MKRRPFAGLTIVALGLAQLPLTAQDTPVPKRPFFNDDETPVRRAVPVQRATPAPGPTPLRAIPVKPLATPAPTAPAATPKAAPPAGPEDPGEIRVSPNAQMTADQGQLALADGLYAKKEYENAAPEYERYLGLYPNGADRIIALFRLGECYRIRGSVNAAKNAYETLLKQFVNGDFIGPAAYRLAELYYQEKDYRDALNLYRKASVRVREPAVINAAKFFSGRCLEALGQRLEARTVYEDLVGVKQDNPFQDASRLSFALLLKEGGRIPEAVKQIQTLAKTTDNPDLKLEATARSGLWSLELEPPQTAQAEADFKIVLGIPGKSPWKELAQLGQIKILAEAGKSQQVLDAYHKLGEISPDTKPQILMAVATAQRQLSNNPEALTTYDQISKEFPGSIYDKEAQFERLRLMYASNDPKLVDEIDKYLLANPEEQKRDEVLLMKAEVLFRKQDYAAAAEIYGPLDLSRTLSMARKAEALFRVGWCQIQTQNLEAAIKAFTAFINGYPTHKLMPMALVQRGLAYQSLKNLGGAQKDYETLLKSFPKVPQRELALQQQALIRGQEGNYTGMADSFKQLLKEFPETAAKIQASYWIGYVAFDAKNYKEAAPYLRDARDLAKEKKAKDPKADDNEQFEEKAGIRLLLAEYYLEDTTATAKEIEIYSKEGKTKVPPEILRWLGKKFNEGSSHESAIKYLDMLIKREEATPEDYMLLGDSQLKIERYKEAASTLQTYLKSVKLPVPRVTGLLALIEAQIGMGALDEAQRSVDEALTLQPEGEWNGRARIKAGDILMKRGKPEEAAKVYESVGVMLDDPEVTPRALEKAMEAWKAAGKEDEAAKTLNKIKSRYPEYWQRKHSTP